MHSAPDQGIGQRHAADYRTQGVQWASAGHPDHAAHLFAAALDLQPTDTRTRMMLADCCVRCRQPANAAEHYLLVALDYARARRIPEAVAICHQVLHLDPTRFVYVAVADMLRRMGRQARPLCARAAELHLGQGRVADALHILRLGAELDARNPQVHRRLAALFLGQHMHRDALVHLLEASRLLLAAGNNGEYIEVAEQLLRYDPHNLETLRELPRVYLRVGEPQRAVHKLSDLMRVSPGDTIGFEILAHAFAVIGRTSTSLSILERLLTELSGTGRRAEAKAIIDRARVWRLEDVEFCRAAVALRATLTSPPPPPKTSRRPPAARPTTVEGTVVLNIADLMAAESEEIVDLSEAVEFNGDEGSMVLRLQDFSIVRPAPTPPPLPRAAHSRAEAESTQIIDISEIEIDEDTLVRSYGDVTAMVLDEESAELRTPARGALPPPVGYRRRARA